MASYSAEDLEAWRNWSREAPISLLKEFLADMDAGETELRHFQELDAEPRRFIIEVQPLKKEKK